MPNIETKYFFIFNYMQLKYIEIKCVSSNNAYSTV